MTSDFIQRTISLQRELRELKTAKKMASWSKFYTAEAPSPVGVAEGGKAVYTIQFEHDEQADRPIVFFNMSRGNPSESYFGAWDAENETLKMTYGFVMNDATIVVGANRPITSITQD